MVRVGILEEETVNHGLVGLCKLFRKNNLTVFTTKQIFSSIEHDFEYIDEIDWIMQKENESTYKFLKRVEKICNDTIDFLVVNTLRNDMFIFFNPKCKKIFRMYNVNWWLYPTSSRMNYFKSIFKVGKNGGFSLMRNCLTGPIFRRMILKKYQGWLLEYKPIEEYIRNNFTTEKKMFTIPIYPFEHSKIENKSENITFTIPGMIAEERRDYLTVIKAYETITSENSEGSELFLLGSPRGEYGDKIIKICEKMKSKGFNINYFTDRVPEGEYRDILNKTNVIISPLRLNYKFSGVLETYTKSKGTGVIADCIKHGKPLIVPQNFVIDDQLKSSIIHYKDIEQLKNILKKITSDTSMLKDLEESAIKNSEKFSLENLQKKSQRMIEEMLDK